MENHFLLQAAFKYGKPSFPSQPEGCFYDQVDGYWKRSSTGEALAPCSVLIDELASKKADVETGEDQKGQ